MATGLGLNFYKFTRRPMLFWPTMAIGGGVYLMKFHFPMTDNYFKNSYNAGKHYDHIKRPVAEDDE